MSAAVRTLPTGLMTKRSLVTLSHAIERAALAAENDGPVVVMAMFQRLPYFERERLVYGKLGVRADVVVAGFVADHRPGLMAAVHPVLLNPDEPSALEWSVVVLSRSMGAYLVAYDEQRAAADGSTLEGARLFAARWGFRRADAAREVARLQDALSDRIPPGALATIDTALTERADDGRDSVGGRLDPAVRLLADQLETERRRTSVLRERLVELAPGDDRDPVSGLPGTVFLDKWLDSDYVGGFSPLPLGLILLSFPGLGAALTKFGNRVVRETFRAIAASLARLSGPGGRAVRLSDDEFLVIAPGASLEQTCSTAHSLSAESQGMRTGYPFLPIAPVVAVMVTRDRPLPLPALRHAIEWARAENVPVAAYGL